MWVMVAYMNYEDIKTLNIKLVATLGLVQHNNQSDRQQETKFYFTKKIVPSLILG